MQPDYNEYPRTHSEPLNDHRLETQWTCWFKTKVWQTEPVDNIDRAETRNSAYILYMSSE